MDLKKDRKLRSYVVKVGNKAIAGTTELLNNERAETAKLAVELTQTALVIALVLIPIGLYYLNNANVTGMPAQQVIAIGSIGIIIVVAIVLSILSKAMKKK